jgi:hypothetical protein
MATPRTDIELTTGAPDGSAYHPSDQQRLISLLFRENSRRHKFWTHWFDNRESWSMCCSKQDIRVHIKTSQEAPREDGTGSVLETSILSDPTNFAIRLGNENGVLFV